MLLSNLEYWTSAQDNHTAVKKTTTFPIFYITTPEQLAAFTGSANISTFCAVLESGALSEVGFRNALNGLGVTSVTTQNELIACMLQAGIVFAT